MRALSCQVSGRSLGSCTPKVMMKCACAFALVLITFNLILSSPMNPNFIPPVIDDKYVLTTHLKSGGYGSVYSGYNADTHAPIIGKLESQVGHSVLSHEYQMMIKIQDKFEGVPRVFAHKELSDVVHGKYQVLIMEQLGPHLRNVVRGKSSHLPESVRVKNLLIFAVQALTRLEHLHAEGILHNDIKPENFLLGLRENNNTVFLIDYGISTTYKTRDMHVHYSDGHWRRGTPGYQSLHNMLGEAQSRRDDVESLGYCLLSLYPGYVLPWAQHNQGEGEAERGDAIQATMLETTISDLCTDAPIEFSSYFRHVKALGFYEKPNYAYLRNQFVSLFERKYKEKIDDARFVY